MTATNIIPMPMPDWLQAPAPTVTVTMFPDMFAQGNEQQSMTWAELCELVSNPPTYADKFDCPLIKLASFGTVTTDRGSLRHDANVLQVFGIEADYDGEAVPLQDAAATLASAGVAAVLYTSASHTPAKPRWRILCPLSVPVPPDARASLVARLDALLGTIVAPESYVLSQTYFAGKVQGVPFESAIVEGQPLDLAGLPDAAVPARAHRLRSRCAVGNWQPLPDDIDDVLGRKPCPIGNGGYLTDWLPTVLGTLNSFGPAAVPHLVRWSLPWYVAKYPTRSAEQIEQIASWDIGNRVQAEGAGLATWENVRESRGLSRSELKQFGPVPQPEWSTPESIESMLLAGQPIPKMDMDKLPPLLKRIALAVSRSVGCDPAVCVASGLYTVAIVADSRQTLRVKHDMTVHGILRLLVVGTPADSKSPGSKPIYAVVKELEKESKGAYEQDMLAWQGKEAQHAASMNAYRQWAESAESELPNAVPPKVIDLPPKPATLRMTTNNVSTGKMLRLLADRAYGIGYTLDDGSEFLTSLVNPNRYDNPDVWLQTYEGGEYVADRVEGGEIYIPNAAVSMYVNGHPDTLYALREKMARNGALQRFIPINLNTELTTSVKQSAEVEQEYTAAMAYWNDAMRNIHAIGPKEYRLTPDGTTLWHEFKAETTDLKKKLQITGHSTYLVGVAGKLDGLAARIALMFHLLSEQRLAAAVPADTLGAAIEFCRFVFRSAAFLDNAHFGADSKEAWVIDYIVVIAGTRQTVSLSEIHRSGRREFEGMPKPVALDVICTAMHLMAQMGWVAMHQQDKHSMAWSINPSLNEMFAARREKLIKARADVVEKIRGSRAG